jgi:hypothetical protein
VRDEPQLRAFHERLAALLNKKLPLREGSNSELDAPNIILDEDAWRIWQLFAQSLEDDCGRDGRWRPVRAAALKMAENVARVAGVLTLFDNPEAEVIDGDIMEAAVEIGLFYLHEALRLVSHHALDSETQAVYELSQWLTQKWPHKLISPTHIQQKAPRHLRGSAEATRKQIEALLRAGVLKIEGPGEVNGKRFKEVYRIIPPDAETQAA